MTADMIARRLPDARARTASSSLDAAAVTSSPSVSALGVPVMRGPEELVDLPQFFGQAAAARDLLALRRADVRGDRGGATAVRRGIEARARELAASGADVIDLGCLPQTPFPHLEEAVAHLKSLGLKVSVDSLEPDELLRGGRAGADYLLSLREDTLWVADEVAATPVLIPREPGDLASLVRAIDALERKGRAYLADPDPRPDPFRLHRLAGTLSCPAARPAEGADHDGHRQPHRAHDADTHGHECPAVRASLPSWTSPRCWSVQVSEHARSRRAGSRHRASHHVCRTRRPALPQELLGCHAGVAREASLPSHSGRDRRARGGRARHQFPHHGERGRRPRATTARGTTAPPIRSPSGRCPSSRTTLRTRSTWAWSWPARRSPGSSASATCRTRSCAGAAAVAPAQENLLGQKAAGTTLHSSPPPRREAGSRMIWETVVTSASSARPACTSRRWAIRDWTGAVVLAPFRPSTTLENLLATRCAAVNLSDDVRVFAGCLTGRREWAAQPCEQIGCVRLDGALAHRELQLARVEENSSAHACIATSSSSACTHPSTASTGRRPR